MFWLKRKLGPRVRTWHIEAVFVALVLGLLTFMTATSYIAWLGAAAVYVTWLYASIADRLSEGPAAERSGVECAWKLKPYYFGKEALWCLYFVALGAWPALAGSVIFIGYGVWRKAWRSYQVKERLNARHERSDGGREIPTPT